MVDQKKCENQNSNKKEYFKTRQAIQASESLWYIILQVCRNINRIKVCMETGSTVILLNLENLYESLYDALNQVYTLNAVQ
jgi:hypothetical protein